jgi:hypothetical protein
LAAAAIAEILAERLNAIGRRVDEAQQFGAAETLLYFGQFDFDRLPKRDKRNKYNKILNARDAFAAKSDIMNRDNMTSADVKQFLFCQTLHHCAQKIAAVAGRLKWEFADKGGIRG